MGSDRPCGGWVAKARTLGPRARPICGMVLVLALVAATAGAQPTTRYSGKVEEVDLQRGLLVVDELGSRGEHQRHEFRVRPETPIVTTTRLRPWAMRGQGPYEEVPVSLVDVLVGDFVVVDAAAKGNGGVARRITIVELSSVTPARR